ncbi:N-acetylmuramoyl-L-alanine amidase [Domibacillus indicus]|uniref:N-acetylmuramoyl-L-alanine amidase n=1 Tax=Domibacillus indicus TaxID=1437523 RepID=UPI000B1DC27C|nr:N-acetylmuramoyl-L-alanine amidase [Domibacillus indicus]
MKKWITFALAFCMLLSLLGIQTPVQAAGFVDVPSRALNEVNYLVQGGVVQGSSPTTFNPYQTITRAEAATFVGRAIQLDGTKRQTRFNDVNPGSFAAGYIESIAAKGIMSGDSSGKFSPEKLVTRGEMAIIIAKAFGYTGNAETALMNLGIASGMSNGSFGSSQTITRADFAVFLSRAINPDFRLKQSVTFSSKLKSTANNLNIRTGPSTAYPSIGKIPAGTSVTGAFSVGGWMFVKTGSVTGFISTYYLSGSTGSGTVTEPATPPASPAPPAAEIDSRIPTQTIILDPGHGGTDPGAVNGSLREKDIVLNVGLKVNKLFEQTPFKVKMTRSTDTFIKLADRSAFAKNNKGNVFVSIHVNSSTNSSANGTETFYYAAGNPYVTDSKLLSSKIQARMLEAWGLKDRGIKNGNLSVLRENNMPAALAELGFISNAGDSAKMKNEAALSKISVAIYNGILDYYKAKGYDITALYR